MKIYVFRNQSVCARLLKSFIPFTLPCLKGEGTWNRYKTIAKDVLRGLEDEQKKGLAVSKPIRKFSLFEYNW